MVHREKEKPGSKDKGGEQLIHHGPICRFRTNPEGENRAASCRPPSVLVPRSALGSCRHGALSSAQAIIHRSAIGRHWQITLPSRSDGGPTRFAGGSSPLPRRIQLAIPLGEDHPFATRQFVRGRDVADRTVQTDFVVIRHEQPPLGQAESPGMPQRPVRRLPNPRTHRP